MYGSSKSSWQQIPTQRRCKRLQKNDQLQSALKLLIVFDHIVDTKLISVIKQITQKQSLHYDWMQVIYWKLSRNNCFDTLQMHIQNCGNTSSLKNLIFAKRLKTITSWKICSPKTKYVLDWETLTGCTRSSFQTVILYASATATSSSATLNSINAKSETIANKSWKHEIRNTRWVSSLWVSSTWFVK